MAALSPTTLLQMAPALLVLLKELSDVTQPGGMTRQEVKELAYAAAPLLSKVNPRLRPVPPKALAQVLCGLLEVQQGIEAVREALQS